MDVDEGSKFTTDPRLTHSNTARVINSLNPFDKRNPGYLKRKLKESSAHKLREQGIKSTIQFRKQFLNLTAPIDDNISLNTPLSSESAANHSCNDLHYNSNPKPNFNLNRVFSSHENYKSQTNSS